MTTATHATEAIELSDPDRSALLVIDVQNDFCAPGGYYDRSGRSLEAIEPAVDRILTLLPVAREAGAPAVFTRSIYDRRYVSSAMVRRQLRRGYPVDYCQEGTWGADFYRLEPTHDDLVLTKHRYSAFLDTNLASMLRDRGVDTLVLCGVATNVCVESTARDGYMRDFDVVLLSDCSATYDDFLHEATLENIRRSFGIVATSDEIIGAWRRTSALAT